jgi:hypothetical protein
MTCPTAMGAIMLVAKSIERQVEFMPKFNNMLKC